MKFESLMLRALFAVCMTVSSLILGSMLLGHPAAKHSVPSTPTTDVAQTATTCPLPPDGVICPREDMRVRAASSHNG